MNIYMETEHYCCEIKCQTHEYTKHFFEIHPPNESTENKKAAKYPLLPGGGGRKEVSGLHVNVTYLHQ